MMKLLASAFMGFAGVMSSLFGGHPAEPPVVTRDHPQENHREMASSSMDQMNASSTDNHGGAHPIGIVGVVTGVTSTTLTVLGHTMIDTATTSYIIDATTAKILKAHVASSTIADIKVTDTVHVGGFMQGSTTLAKIIIDGPIPSIASSTMPKGMRMPLGAPGMTEQGRPPLHSTSTATSTRK